MRGVKIFKKDDCIVKKTKKKYLDKILNTLAQNS